MISTAQIRAARGLLKWTQAALAHKASISTVTLNMIENEVARPRDSTLSAIQAALEVGGVDSWRRTALASACAFVGPKRPDDTVRVLATLG